MASGQKTKKREQKDYTKKRSYASQLPLLKLPALYVTPLSSNFVRCSLRHSSRCELPYSTLLLHSSFFLLLPPTEVHLMSSRCDDTDTLMMMTLLFVRSFVLVFVMDTVVMKWKP